MATSLLFNINRHVILEYIYSDIGSPVERSTNDIGFRRVINGHADDENTIINKDNARTVTRNIVDDTVIELSEGRYALLDNDSAYFYPNTDPEVTVSDIAITPVLNITYDKVRIHIISGYNFEGFEGFIVSLYMRMNNDKIVRLCNLSHIKSDSLKLFFNPKPLKLAEFIYDKYVEFDIPSQDFILTQQEATPQSTTTFSYYVTNGVYLANQKTIYCEYKNIKNIIAEDGLIFFEPDETIKFAFNSVDKFDLLIARIQESDDGDYFEYYAEWNNNLIEDFIFQLNSVAGNRFFIIHELRVIEQVGETFTETDNFTSIQTDNYDSIKRFRPILQLAGSAVSFSIEYTVRLYNSVDGRSIFKVSSITSTDVNKYGEKTTMLNIGDTTSQLKVYNKVTSKPEYTIVDNLLRLTSTKILSTFTNNSNIVVSSDSDIDNSIDGLVIKIVPFDNIFKFNLSERDDPEDEESLVSIGLDSISEYFMVFVKNDNSKLYIPEFISDNFNKENGEIAFKMNKQESSDIALITVHTIFYVIAKNPDGTETVLFSGEFEDDRNRTSKRTPSFQQFFVPKIATVLLLLFMTLFGYSQSKSQYDDYQYLQEEVYDYGKDYWYTFNNLYGMADWGISSFYWGVTRSTNRDIDDYYKYNVCFLSNSYIWDYYNEISIWEYTHICNLKISVDGSEVVSSKDGFSFRELFFADILTFYSKKSKPYISISCHHKML